MKRILIAIIFIAGSLAAQTQDEYLDITILRPRLEKRAEFDALTKRFAEINRKNKGDNYFAYEVMYGETNTLYFVSSRRNLAAIEDGFNAFMGAFAKALTPAAMAKLFQDGNNSTQSTHAEIRRRRWDLSSNVVDAAGLNKLMAESRWIRAVVVRVRPGRSSEYENRLRINKAAAERTNPGVATFVTQTVAGGSPYTYYFTTLAKSFADFDKMKTPQEVLSPQGYTDYQRVVAEMVISVDVLIGRFTPEFANPPEAVAVLDPKFWRPAPPKPAPAKQEAAPKVQ